MKLVDIKIVLISILAALLFHSVALSMTIQLGSEGIEFIRPGDEWQFFRGTEPPSDPADAWQEIDFNDLGWETGQSGFGYGDGDDETILSDMQDNYLTVYIRKEFTLDTVPASGQVVLEIDFDRLRVQDVANKVRHMLALRLPNEAGYGTARGSNQENKACKPDKQQYLPESLLLVRGCDAGRDRIHHQLDQVQRNERQQALDEHQADVRHCPAPRTTPDQSHGPAYAQSSQSYLRHSHSLSIPRRFSRKK